MDIVEDFKAIFSEGKDFLLSRIKTVIALGLIGVVVQVLLMFFVLFPAALLKMGTLFLLLSILIILAFTLIAWFLGLVVKWAFVLLPKSDDVGVIPRILTTVAPRALKVAVINFVLGVVFVVPILLISVVFLGLSFAALVGSITMFSGHAPGKSAGLPFLSAGSMDLFASLGIFFILILVVSIIRLIVDFFIQFASFFIVVEGMGIIAALKKSIDVVLANLFRVLILDILLAVVMWLLALPASIIIGIITLPVAGILGGIYTGLASALISSSTTGKVALALISGQKSALSTGISFLKTVGKFTGYFVTWLFTIPLSQSLGLAFFNRVARGKAKGTK